MSVRKYGSDSDNDDILDNMLQTNECCGGDHWTDFKEHATEWERKNKGYEVPLSCCKLNDPSERIIESNLVERTCPTRPTRMNSYIGKACNEQGGPFTGLLRVFFYGIMGVVFGLIAVELVGIIFAICLIRYIGDPRAVPV
ncbi:uncharacterized protein LOC124255467 [Haliotis rubra]|uniref:uncharacterized protein LOC124255467 n=1 Tax=Haliotis rubra TaxID=36100 RepID=UPI001EE5D159|nr:uncharacterized protein LOC124255467 [Haliotis rubra]